MNNNPHIFQRTVASIRLPIPIALHGEPIQDDIGAVPCIAIGLAVGIGLGAGIHTGPVVVADAGRVYTTETAPITGAGQVGIEAPKDVKLS